MVLAIAGSETTATALTGATYLIATNPRVMARLAEEVRCCFKDERDIRLTGASNLPYLSAVIKESLRIYPPGPNTQPRITPPGGNIILGDHIPGKVSLYTPDSGKSSHLSNHQLSTDGPGNSPTSSIS